MTETISTHANDDASDDLTLGNGYPPVHPIVRRLPPLPEAQQKVIFCKIQETKKLPPLTIHGGRIANHIPECKAAVTLGIPFEQVPREEFVGTDDDLYSHLVVSLACDPRYSPSQVAMSMSGVATMRQGERTDLHQKN